jgi:hypothetical protein
MSGKFMVRVLLFGHKIQTFVFWLSSKYKIYMEQFKFKILDNSIYVNFHGGGDFSLAYVMMCQYFGKNP